MSLSLVTKKMQIKTRWRHHHTPTRMVKIKRTDNIKCCRAYEAIGSLTAGGSASIISLENSLASSHTHGIRPRNSTLRYFSEKGEAYVYTKACI